MQREGEQFGPYHLVKQIALGGMAEIYLAKSSGFSGFEKFVALKMIHPNYSADQHFVQMLIEEAKITVYLNHVNVAQIFDLGRIGDIYYIAMEFIDGGDLYRMMRSLTERDLDMPVDVAAYIIHEACSGLDYAHRCRDQLGNPLNVIHRDISPQNILISLAGEVKIVDFGIAKAALRARQTAVGVIKGKYYYMSPEQAWGDPIDARSDIFSTGVVLYEILAGQMLYLEEDVAKLLDMVRKCEIPPLSNRRPDVPPALEKVVMKAVAKKPEERWQNAYDFQRALQEFLHGWAPTFSVHRLQDVVRTAMLKEAPVREQLFSVSADDLMSRDEFSLHTSHSVIFASHQPTDPVQRPSPFRMLAEDEFDDATVVSGPPDFSGLVDEVDGDPALPVISSGVRRGGFADMPTDVPGRDRVADMPTDVPVRVRPLRQSDRPAVGRAADPRRAPPSDSVDWDTDEEPTLVKDDARAEPPASLGDEAPTMPAHPGPALRAATGRPSSAPGRPPPQRRAAAQPPPQRGAPAQQPLQRGIPAQSPPQRAVSPQPEAPLVTPPPPDDWPTAPRAEPGVVPPGTMPPPPDDWRGSPAQAAHPAQQQQWAGQPGAQQQWGAQAGGYPMEQGGYPAGGVAAWPGQAYDEDWDDEALELSLYRARTKRVVGIVVAAVVVVVSLAVTLVLFLPLSDEATTGEVRIITDPPGAQVECDGQLQPGVTPDVVVRGLAADENHSLYIRLEGYIPKHKSFSVEAGRRTMVKVKLEPESSGL